MSNYHIGFFNKITVHGTNVEHEVVDVCDSITGRLVAYASTRQDAEKIVAADKEIARLEAQIKAAKAYGEESEAPFYKMMQELNK